MLHTFAIYNASFLLLVALRIVLIIIIPLQLSLIHQLAISAHISFAPNVKICGTSGKIISLKMKGMSSHEKEGEQGDAYTKTRNSFITPFLHLCFFLMCSYLLFVDKNTVRMQLILC